MGPVRVLLDTHALISWLFDDPSLSPIAREAIRDPRHEVLVSSVSAWAIATKHRLGKLPEPGDLSSRFSHCASAARFRELPVSISHALAAGSVATADPVFASYGATVIWR